MKEILDNSFQHDTLRKLEYILEKKESERILTNFERFLYTYAGQNIIAGKSTNISPVPVISISATFLAIVLYRDRNKSLLKLGIKSLMALDPMISIAIDDLNKGQPPFCSLEKPLLKVAAYLLTGIVTIPMYIAYKIIPQDKMKKVFNTVDKVKNCFIKNEQEYPHLYR